MALKIENECFFQREKEDRRNKEKGGRTAGPLLAEVPTSWEQNEGMLELSVHLPLPGAEHSPQPPSPPREAAAFGTVWHSGSGTVLFGLLTRMFTYTSQVIRSPSVVFWGSKTNVGHSPVLWPPYLSGSDLLSQAFGEKPRLVSRGLSGRQSWAHSQWHHCPLTSPSDRVSQLTVPTNSGDEGLLRLPESAVWR